MVWLRNILLFGLASMLLSACSSTPQHTDTPVKGTIEISADETYQPVIEEELRIFDSSYPEAKITIHYKPEAECFKDYFANKARVILVTRPLTKEEQAFCTQEKIYPTVTSLARDGVAVILNSQSADTLLDMDALRGILTGIYKKKYTVVFDNQGSSTVRYITDSLLKGAALGANTYAAKGNSQVLDYVKKNPDAIGFVGLGYVSDTADPANTGSFIKSVHVAMIKNDSTREFLLPYQAYVALKTYPLTRTLYAINREPYRGLGTGFADFLSGQRGQLVLFHAHMFPTKSEMVIRDAEISH